MNSPGDNMFVPEKPLDALRAAEAAPEIERRSSVKIKTNAQGRPLPEVTAYSHDYDRLEECKREAVRIYNETVKALA